MATKIVKVVKEHEADDYTDSLTLEAGEMLIVLQEPDTSGRQAFGRKLATGEEGYFPFDHCEEVNTGPAPPGSAEQAALLSSAEEAKPTDDDPFAMYGQSEPDKQTDEGPSVIDDLLAISSEPAASSSTSDPIPSAPLTSAADDPFADLNQDEDPFAVGDMDIDVPPMEGGESKEKVEPAPAENERKIESAGVDLYAMKPEGASTTGDPIADASNAATADGGYDLFASGGDALPSYDDVVAADATTQGSTADPYAGTALAAGAAPVAFQIDTTSAPSAPPPQSYAESREQRDYELAMQMQYEWNNPEVEGILGDFVHAKAERVKSQKNVGYIEKRNDAREHRRQVRGRRAEKGTFEDCAKNSCLGICITDCVKRCGPFCFLFWILVCFVNLVLIIVAVSVNELSVIDITSKGLSSDEATGDYTVQCGAFTSRVTGDSDFTMYYDDIEVSPICEKLESEFEDDYKEGCWDLSSNQLIGLRSYGCWYFFFALCSIIPLGWACCGRQCACFTCGENGQYTSMTGMLCTWSLQFIAAVAWMASPANDEYCWKIMDRDTYSGDQKYYVPDCDGCFEEDYGSSLEIALWGGGFAFIGVIIVFCVLVAAVSGEADLMEDQWGDICCCDDGSYDGGGHSGPCYCYCAGSGGGGGGGGCCECGTCECGTCDCGGCDCGGCDCGGGC